MKFGCSIGIFLNSANLICRSTDISKCFRGSLRFRDRKSRLYILLKTESHERDGKCRVGSWLVKMWNTGHSLNHRLEQNVISTMTLDGTKGPENINPTTTRYEETFNGRHKVLNTIN